MEDIYYKVTKLKNGKVCEGILSIIKYSSKESAIEQLELAAAWFVGSGLTDFIYYVDKYVDGKLKTHVAVLTAEKGIEHNE